MDAGTSIVGTHTAAAGAVLGFADQVRATVCKLAWWIVAAVIVTLCVFALAACAPKMGTALNVKEAATPVDFADPSHTNSVHVIGENTTAIAGPLTSETAQFTAGKLVETTAGGASKQRANVTLGNVDLLLSLASDIEASDIRLEFGDGSESTGGKAVVKSATIGKLRTSNSQVEQAVAARAREYVTTWINATDAERAVLEKQLDTQAKAADAAASIAQAAIAALKKIP